MIRILIADDHAIVREGLKQIASGFSDIYVAGEAGNGHEVIEQVSKGNFDVIILDIAMPGKNGLDTLKQIKQERPHLAVLMLSMHPEEQYAIRALKAGASGYLTKQSAPRELVGAILKVSGGGRYVSLSLAEKLACALNDDDCRQPHEALSDREYQVTCMIASGRTIREIAEELCLSEKTISTYRSRILEKMNIKNNAELTRYAIKHGLVD